MGGARQLSTVLAVVKSQTRANELLEIAQNGSGTAMKAQEQYAESLSGKMAGLSSNISILWQTLINSNEVGVVIDTFSNMVELTTKLVDNFGAITLAVGGTTLALSLFNDSFKNFTVSIAGKFTNVFKTWNDEIDSFEEKIVELKEKIETNKASLAKKGKTFESDKDDLALEVEADELELSRLQDALRKTELRSIALKTALSVGLSLAITGVSLAIKGLIDYTNLADNYFEKLTNTINNFNSSTKELKTERNNIGSFEYYSKQLETLTKGTDEYKEAQEKLLEQKELLIETDIRYAVALNDSTKSLEEQVSALQRINELRMRELATETEKSLTGGQWWDFAGEATFENKIKMTAHNIEEAQNRLEVFSATQKNAGQQAYDNAKRLGLAEIEAEEIRQQAMARYQKQVDGTKERIAELEEELDRLVYDADAHNQLVQDVIDIKGKSAVREIKYSDAIAQTVKVIRKEEDALDENTESVEKNTEAKQENVDIILKSKDQINEQNQQAQDSYLEEMDALQNLKVLLKDISENGMSLDNAKELREMFSDFVGDITNATEVQEYLNEKIDEQTEKALLSYEQVMAYDKDFFNNKVKNTEAFNNWKEAVEKALLDYENQLRKNGNTQEAEFFKNKRTMALEDLKNAESIAQARASLENQLINGMSQQWAHYYQNFNLEEMKNMLSFYEANKHTLSGQEAIDRANLAKDMQMYVNFIESMSKPMTVDLPDLKLPSLSSSSSSSSSSNSSTKEEVADLDLVIDRYYELENAMKRVENALSLNKTKQENATATEKVKLMKEEVELLKEKQELTEKYRKELTKEANELKKSLSKNGVLFDSQGNITNYAKLLTQLEKSANKLSGEAKENKINAIEKLVDDIERYTELINSSIPSMTEDWADLTNQIKEAQRAQLEYVTDIQEKITDALKDELQKRTDAVKAELEKQKNLYNEQFEEEDWKDSLTKEQRKLDELKQQISSLSRDTSLAGQLKLEDLMSQYEEQLEVINQMIRDREKEKGNEAFDSAIEDLDQKLENALDPKNLAQMVNQALTQGFIDLGGEVISTENLLTQMLETSGEAFTALGQTLRNELIDGLQVAKGLASDLGSVINGIGFSNNARSVMSVSSASSQLTSRMVGGLDAVSTVGRQVEQAINLTFKNLLNVEGNLDSTILADVELMLDNAKNEITYSVAKALQTI